MKAAKVTGASIPDHPLHTRMIREIHGASPGARARGKFRIPANAVSAPSGRELHCECNSLRVPLATPCIPRLQDLGENNLTRALRGRGEFRHQDVQRSSGFFP